MSDSSLPSNITLTPAEIQELGEGLNRRELVSWLRRCKLPVQTFDPATGTQRADKDILIAILLRDVESASQHAPAARTPYTESSTM